MPDFNLCTTSISFKAKDIPNTFTPVIQLTSKNAFNTTTPVNRYILININLENLSGIVHLMRKKAKQFELYLKSASGRAFKKKRLI